jgi:hypothetical protein
MSTIEVVPDKSLQAPPQVMIGFYPEAEAYILPAYFTEVCREGILRHHQDLQSNASQDLDALRVIENEVLVMPVVAARAVNGGIDTMYEASLEEFGADDEQTKLLYELSLKLSLAIFQHDTTIGRDAMETMARRQRSFRTWFGGVFGTLSREDRTL